MRKNEKRSPCTFITCKSAQGPHTMDASGSKNIHLHTKTVKRDLHLHFIFIFPQDNYTYPAFLLLLFFLQKEIFGFISSNHMAAWEKPQTI